MKYCFATGFRPFGGFQREWFSKRYFFDTRKERNAFANSLPRYRFHYPFTFGFFVATEEEIKMFYKGE